MYVRHSTYIYLIQAEFLRDYRLATKDVPHPDSYEYAQMRDVYEAQCAKALTKVEKFYVRRAYDYVAIANPDNGVEWFNMCVRYSRWSDGKNRFTINKLTELGRSSLPPVE